jgi:hypothetical protein
MLAAAAKCTVCRASPFFVQECGHLSDQMLMVSQRRMLFLACEWILGWAKHTHSSAQASRLGGCHVGFASIRGSFPADFLHQIATSGLQEHWPRWAAPGCSHCGQARSSAFFNMVLKSWVNLNSVRVAGPPRRACMLVSQVGRPPGSLPRTAGSWRCNRPGTSGSAPRAGDLEPASTRKSSLRLPVVLS